MIEVVDTAVNLVKTNAITSGVSLAVLLFAKFCPKQKIVDCLAPKCRALGRFISRFLILRLGTKAAEKVEEGIIVTMLTTASTLCSATLEGLLEDNEKKK